MIRHNFSQQNIRFSHEPVLLNEVIEYLNPQDNETYVDCTFGAGGYSRTILKSSSCNLYAIDRDSDVSDFAMSIKKDFPKNFHFIQGRFSDIEKLLPSDVTSVDGIVLDIGVSSMQLENSTRGFSFNLDARLDMRMGGSNSVSAFEVVNEFSEKEIAEIIKTFGEEKKYRQIAKAIVSFRKNKEIKTTFELADIVRKFYSKANHKIDPATKTFQAIRIYVNEELEELKQVLESSKKLLKKGGRLIVVSFHSLEDSYVKNFLRKESGYFDKQSSRYEFVPEINQNKQYSFFIKTKSSIKPSNEEIKNNIRARSARMRVGIKC